MQFLPEIYAFFVHLSLSHKAAQFSKGFFVKNPKTLKVGLLDTFQGNFGVLFHFKFLHAFLCLNITKRKRIRKQGLPNLISLYLYIFPSAKNIPLFFKSSLKLESTCPKVKANLLNPQAF